MPEPGEIGALVDRLKSVLAGNPPELQGAALADLVAIHIAGHVVRGDQAATERLRANLLDLHILCVRALIQPNAKMIGTAA